MSKLSDFLGALDPQRAKDAPLESPMNRERSVAVAPNPPERADDALSLLAQIRDALEELTPSGMAEDYVDYKDLLCGTAAGNHMLEFPGQFGYLYIPNSPRALTLWSGIGHSRYIGEVAAGSHASITIPKGQVLMIEYAAGSAVQTLSIWASSRPIHYGDIAGGGIGSLASAVHIEDAPASSGDAGVALLLQRQDTTPVLTGTNGDYTFGVADAKGRQVIMIGGFFNTTDGSLAGPNSIQDPSGNAGQLIVSAYTYNGVSYDRPRGNVELTILASAARTASTNSADQVNYNGRGINVYLNITAVPGVDTITLTVEEKDPVSGVYYLRFTGAAIAAVQSNIYTVYPGITENALIDFSTPLGRTWRVRVLHSGVGSFTYSVGASNIL